MADLFSCDKCGAIGPKTGKAGRLIVQELGQGDQMPHPALYNRKAELCSICFNEIRRSIKDQFNRPTFAEASDITREANIAITVIES